MQKLLAWHRDLLGMSAAPLSLPAELMLVYALLYEDSCLEKVSKFAVRASAATADAAGLGGADTTGKLQLSCGRRHAVFWSAAGAYGPVYVLASARSQPCMQCHCKPSR